MVRPVVGSVSAGGTGATSFSERLAKARILSGRLRAREALTSAWASLREAKMGASERDSAPPVGRLGGGLNGGGAGAGGGVGGERARQLAPQHDLAGDEGRELRRHHLTEDERVELGEGQAAAGHQLVHEERAQVHGGEILEVAVRADEGGSKAGDHGHAGRWRTVGRGSRVVRLVLPAMGHEYPRVDSRITCLIE
jgi:hypothetical protein